MQWENCVFLETGRAPRLTAAGILGSLLIKFADMGNIIPHLRIRNFKSIKDLSLECERINVFIGRPNAGKSNILEAISMLGEGYAGERFLEGLARYNSVFQIFNNFDTRNAVNIQTDIIGVELTKKLDETFSLRIEPTDIANEGGDPDKVKDTIEIGGEIYEIQEPEVREYYPFKNRKDMYVNTYRFERGNGSAEIDLIKQTRDVQIQLDGSIINRNIYGHNFSPVKRYEFKPQNGPDTSEHSFFLPPHGGNFYRIIRSHEELRKEIRRFLEPNGLELLLDEEKREVSILQREEMALLRFPLHLVPDTFQRYIFHLAAIMSNQHSVLLFEEPEVHSYGPYIYQLAQHILDDPGGNQYFITTHNPYLLLPLIQEEKGVAVFTTWFEGYQTHVHRLSESELREMLDYGIDVFLNLDQFIPA